MIDPTRNIIKNNPKVKLLEDLFMPEQMQEYPNNIRINEFGESVVVQDTPILLNQQQTVKEKIDDKKEVINDFNNLGTSNVKEPEIVSQNKLVQEVTNIEAEKSNNINSNFKKYYLVGGIILLTAIVSFFIFKRKKNE